MDPSDPLALLKLYLQSTISSEDPEEVSNKLNRKLNLLKELRKEIDIQIIQTYRERNVTTSAIYRLPTELLIRIFHFALPPCENPNGPILQQLRSVSHKWMQIVDGAPQLWRRIHGQDEILHLKQVLDRSAGGSLDVYWDFRDPKQINSEQFFQAIEGTIGRWRSATLRLDQTAQRSAVRRTLETEGAPLLEDLVLLLRSRGTITEWRSRPLGLFWRQPAPKLRNVWISQLPVVLNPRVFANLENLHIHAIPSTPTELLLILQNSPGLRSLSLDYLELAITDLPITESTGTPVHLPELEKLHVCATVFPYSRYIFAIVDAPNCDNFNLATHLGPTFPHYHFSLDGLSQFEAAIKRGAWEIAITIRRPGDYGIACSGTSCVSLDVSSETALSHSIDWLNSVVGDDASPIPISLLFEDYDFSHPTFQFLLPILERIQDLTDIIIGSESINAHGFIAALAEPDVDANDIIANRWPNIKKLRINPRRNYLLPHLLDMVKSRMNVRNVRMSNGYFGYHNVQELYFGERLSTQPPVDGRTAEQLRLIQGLLYPGMVYWFGSPVAKLRVSQPYEEDSLGVFSSSPGRPYVDLPY
ncbi:hypothetical protein FRC01_014229 [Tulasnella sp. 417]|nr:hypothetical protein FRC01_014229 [Tulasnella sp. 417]